MSHLKLEIFQDMTKLKQKFFIINYIPTMIIFDCIHTENLSLVACVQDRQVDFHGNTKLSSLKQNLASNQLILQG